MKRILIGITSIAIISVIWISFIGFSDGVENVSSGNYFTPTDKNDIPHISGQEFTVNLSANLQLFGKVRDSVFPDKIAVTLKLTGTRNRSLYFGADPLPSPKDIASVVEGELIRLGLKSGIRLAIITLPLEQSQLIDDRMQPIKM